MTRYTFTLRSHGDREKVRRHAPCGVEGCERNAHPVAKGGRGYCSRHYYRLLKHGDPLGGRVAPGEPERHLREIVFRHVGDECLIWPYARNSAGYGHLHVAGKDSLVHRLACAHRHGPPPTEHHHAAHSCGNGHEGCCNPNHLRWATPSENILERKEHGTEPNGERHYAAKLTEDNVRTIRKSRLSSAELGRRYGCDPANIAAIRARRSWRHVP